MKIALLLSGLPRKVKEGFQNNWSYLLGKYDVDIYLHMWKDVDYGSSWVETYETYNPSDERVKFITLQSPFKFTDYKEGIALPHTDKSRPLEQYDVISCFRQLPMFYSWQVVYRACYESRNKYDCIVRSRYDLVFNNIPDIEALDLTKLNHGPGGNYLDDNICITNQSNADQIFFNVFEDVLKYTRESGYLGSAEQTWTALVSRAKLEPAVVESLRFYLLRENMLWWGN